MSARDVGGRGVTARAAGSRRVAARAVLPWAAAVVAVATVAVGLVLDARGHAARRPASAVHRRVRAARASAAARRRSRASSRRSRSSRGCCAPARRSSSPALFGAHARAAARARRRAAGAVGVGSPVPDPARAARARTSTCRRMPAFDYGPGFVLDRFAELVPSLPVHAAGHPPGLLLVMHYLGLDTAPRLAAFCILVGALSAPLTYVLGRRLLDERTARIAGLLAALSPAMLHFGATSADAVFLTLGLLAAIPLLSQRRAGARRGRCSPSVTLFAWSLLAVGAWAAILVLVRDGLKPALRLSVLIGVALRSRFHAAVRARHRLRPDRHHPGHRAGLPRRDRVAAPLRVLAVRLADRVPADPRRADHLAGAASGAQPGGDRDLRRDRDRRGPRLHEGRDRADLALPRPVRVPRGGAAGQAARR